MNKPTSPLNEYELYALKSARALVPGDPPSPWKLRLSFSAAGLRAGGWDTQENFIVISMDGYSINSPVTGEKSLILGSDEALDSLIDNDLKFRIPTSGEIINVFGVTAGDGIHVTDDSWSLEIIYPWWPQAIVTLEKLYQGAPHDWGTTYALKTDLGDGWVKCGFSSSGKHFALLGEPGVDLFTRSGV